MTFLDQYIVSRTKSRMRLRIPQLKSNETAVKIFDEVRNVAGIETADINETTGSLLIRFVPELFDEQQLTLQETCSFQPLFELSFLLMLQLSS